MTSFELVLQAPGGDDTLLSRMAAAAESADGGGCIMAWTTTHGVRAFLHNPAVDALTRRGPFEVVVGTDSITDPAALTELRVRVTERPALVVRAFAHDTQALFHPKIAWFQTSTELTLFTGSGNLTRGGLGANWEAFTVSRVAGEEAARLREQLDSWRVENAVYLLDLDDPLVDLAVSTNAGNERALRITAAPPVEPVRSGGSCLVAELTKNRKDRDGNPMFSQANFPKAIFESFFGLTERGGPLLLYPVQPDGTVGALESREGRYKPVSINYYVELSTVGGIIYPTDGPPIAAFRRLDTREFLYIVRLPGDSGYDELAALLDQRWAGGSRQLRRVSLSFDDLVAFWPATPLREPLLPGM